MGKRERRRRRERSVATAVPTPPVPRRREASPAAIAVAADSLTCQLAALAERQRAAQVDVDGEVDRLVAAGVGWPPIASALGVSRQAARQRWLRRHC